MRAQCESCNKPQPADWRPGDLCVHCGNAVREQGRCYWCAHWVPVGNFCRSCGAEGIAPEQYAPARMMKFYGSDMFSIPRMLREMDPARIETFRSLYGRHHGIALRHVEELRELETELFHKHWSSELEEELIPQLPWPEDKLALYAPLENSGQKSPFPIIRDLAELVAVRKGEFALLTSASSGLRGVGKMPLETALQLANWRVSGNAYLEGIRYTVLDVLRAMPEPKSELVQLSQVYLGEREAKAPEGALDSSDPEVQFFAAVIEAHEPTLIRALRSSNPLQQNVAADKLIKLRRVGEMVDYYIEADPERQKRLIDQILIVKHPVPELHDALFETIRIQRGISKTETIRQSLASRLAHAAAKAITLGCNHSEAMRLANLLDWDVLHSLSVCKLDPETFREIGELLVREDLVNMNKYAWSCFAAPGRMPQDFVERVFQSASARAQNELVMFAEKQLEETPERPLGTSMERVLILAAFGDYPTEVITTAWAAMHRQNYRREYGSPSPFPYSVENIEKFWPMHEFERRLATLQANSEAMKGTFVADELHRFLKSGDRRNH